MSKIETIVGVADIQIRNFHRLDEFKAIIDKFLYDMKVMNPDRIVIAGDVVHSKTTISPEAQNLLQYFIRGCTKYAGKVIMIPGNHDLIENNTERLDSLTPIVNALNIPNLVYVTKSSMLIDENIRWSLFSIIDDNEKVEIERGDAEKVIGVYHGAVNGLYTDSGFQFTSEVDMDLFSECDFVFAGDIHKRQVLKGDNNTLVMIGSMVQQNFYETVSAHGYVIYNVSDDSYNFVDIEAPVKRKRFLITDFSDIMNNKEVLVND